MKPEALIFDIDGTLWDSRQLVAEAYNLQLRSEGLDHLQTTAEELKGLFGKVMDVIADILFAEIPLPERRALQKRCAQSEQRYLRSNPCHIGYPGVKETLETLKKNYRLFIVSNSQKGYPELCMEKLGLSQLFEGHLCFGETGTSKGQTILTLMKQYGLQNVVYIGDTQGDLDACREAGIPFLFASYGFGQVESCDWKIDAITDLPRLAEQNWEGSAWASV